MFFFSIAASAPSSGNSSALALFVLIVAVAGWMGLRTLIRRLRAGKAEAVVHGAFTDYALEALVNAAKLDGRVNASERAAIVSAMAGVDRAVDATRVDAAFERAVLSKDELVAYLSERAGVFKRAQKVQLLQALLAVFVADGSFDEVEHHALVEYTAAIGFDRQSAPTMLAEMARKFARGDIT